MKFCREWKSCISEFPKILAKECINYKTWKKKALVYHDSFLIDLKKEMKRVDVFLKNIVNKWISNDKNIQKNDVIFSNLINNFLVSKNPFTAKQLLDFIALNRRTIQKLCKKIDKKAKLNGLFRYWYDNVAKKKYDFLTNKINFTYLKFTSCQKSETCPICLEEEYSDFIIMKCGHVMCMDCLHNMTQHTLKRMNGTTENILHNYEHSHAVCCPMCRIPSPFSKFVLYMKSKSQK